MAQAKSSPIKDSKLAIKICPTLFLGVGGTGRLVLTEIKRLFLEHPNFNGQVPPMVEFLCIDTDDGRGTWRDEKKRSHDLKDDQFLYVTADLNDVRNNIVNKEFLSDWLPVDHLVSVDLSGRGANQLRYLGRLCFFESIQGIYNAIKTKLDTITLTQNKISTDQIQTQPLPPAIFVVNSICGGTGSGMVTDMGYLVREMANNYVYNNIKPFISGYFFTSSAFKIPSDMSNLHANTAASLMELNYFMTPNHNRFQMDYSNSIGIRNSANEKPYDLIYLVNGTGIDSTTLTGNIMAHTLFSEVITDIGDSLQSKRANKAYYRFEPVEKKCTAFSTFGFSSLFLPAEKLHKLFQLWFSRDMMSMITHGDVSAISKLTDQFMSRNGLTIGSPEGSLFSIEEIYPERDLQKVVTYTSLDANEIAEADLLMTVDNYKRLNEFNVSKFSAIEATIKNRSQKLCENFTKAVYAKVSEILGAQDHCVEGAEIFLKNLLKKFDEVKNSWLQIIDKYEASKLACVNEFNRQRSELVKILDQPWYNKLFSNRRQMIEDQLLCISSAVRKINSEFFKKYRMEKLIGIIDAISEFTGAILDKAIVPFHNALDNILNVDLPRYIKSALENINSDIDGNLFVDRCVLDKDIDIIEGNWLYNNTLFSTCQPDEMLEKKTMLKLKSDILAGSSMQTEWRKYSINFGLFKDIMENFAKSQFEKIKTMSIGSFYKSKADYLYNGDSAKMQNYFFDKLNNRFMASKPITVFYQKKGNFDWFGEFLLLGVPTPADNIFSQANINKLPAHINKSTDFIGFPQRIIMVQTVEAIPVSTVEDIDTWTTAYLNQLKTGRPLHAVVNQLSIDWNFHKLVRNRFEKYVKEASSAFYLGFKLGIIKERKKRLAEDKRYYISKNEESPEGFSMDLGDTPVESIKELCTDTGKLVNINQRIKTCPGFVELGLKGVLALIENEIEEIGEAIANPEVVEKHRQEFKIVLKGLEENREDVERKIKEMISKGHAKRSKNSLN